jgi:hypothetical protein
MELLQGRETCHRVVKGGGTRAQRGAGGSARTYPSGVSGDGLVVAFHAELSAGCEAAKRDGVPAVVQSESEGRI